MALARNGHYNGHMQNAWNKYGKDAFEFGIVCECTEDKLDELERYYIATNRSNEVEFGYNEESGGNKFKHHSERSKAKISEKTSGKNNPMYGVHLVFSEETRRKLSIVHSGVNNGFYGKHHTEEAKRRMSEKKRGTKQSIETRINKKNARPVRCINNGMVFPGLAFASEWAKGTAPESISKVCYHKQKTAGMDPVTNERLKWEFI